MDANAEGRRWSDTEGGEWGEKVVYIFAGFLWGYAELGLDAGILLLFYGAFLWTHFTFFLCFSRASDKL